MTKLKDSGIPWIGEIPEHWEVMRFKSKFATRKGLSITKADLTESGIPVVSYGQIHSKYNNGTHLSSELLRYVPLKFLKSDYYALVSKGDFIFADTSEDIVGCGNAAYVDYSDNLFAGYHSIIASGGENNKYFAYLFQTDAWRSQIRNSVTGIKVFSISQSILSNTLLIVPPMAEQEQIAEYLDEKCGEIDELIDVEQQMISDLESYRQAIITEAVTHGINPDVPTKDSNIPQIPLIPKNWVTTKIKFLSNLYSGSNITTEEITNSGYPVYGGNGLRGFYDRYNKDGEFVLIGRQGALCGNINYAYGKFWASEHAIVCHPLIEYHLIWFGELLRSMNLNQYSVAAAQPGLSVDKIKNLHIPVPPLAEQVEIGEYIQGKCSEIDELIKVKQEKIETLKQYRQSLIFEAVTGKITIA
ncbi:MAG: restriction endonuclease subunit S [Bacteroidales bacterium]|nr:restriction endonuclease subunit S [Bacteroidales bacterium]